MDVEEPCNLGPRVESEPSKLATAPNLPQDLLIVVFIHGFKGTDSTFGGFPDRLRHILSETVQNIVVESVVFPAYETKGELVAAVTRFADWLTDLTVRREVSNGIGGGAGKAKIVLCGHSMGGLLAADALVEFVNTRPDPKAPIWPNIIACIAFDTPYLGLHPFVFKNTVTQAAEYVRSAQNLFAGLQFPSSSQSGPPVPPKTPMTVLPPPRAPQAQGTTSLWQRFAPAAYAVGGALIAGAAIGSAYYKSDEIGAGYTWATDHMKYVGTLWDEKTLQARIEKLLAIEEHLGVTFRTFYTYIPPSKPSNPNPRTFIVLPKPHSRVSEHFLKAPNTVASDEIQAHIGMFESKSNDGYYELGLLTAQLIRDALTVHRAVVDDHPIKSLESRAEDVPIEECAAHQEL